MPFITNANQNIRALCTEGRLKEALHILLTAHNFPIEISTYLHLLQACIANRALSEGKQIHSHINEKGFAFTPPTLLPNKLINMYDKCGSLAGARKVFHDMSEPDVFSWNMIISAYRRHGLPQETLTLFYEMQRTAVQPDQFTFSNILPSCANVASVKHGLQIHGKIIRCGFLSDGIVMNTLIDMYAKCGRISKGRQLFDKMHNADVVSWNAMITGYAQSGSLEEALRVFEEIPKGKGNVVSWTAIIAGCVQNGLVHKALEFFQEMHLAGVKPDSATFSTVLPACAKIGDLEMGNEIHRKIIESQNVSDIVVTNALIDMYAKCGSIKKAHDLFGKMPQPDVVSWTTIIAGCTQSGLVEEALEIFKQMQLVGVRPDSSTFASILPACAKLGVLKKGIEIHQKIIENGFCSGVVANAVIDMYAKCGSIQKARELFDKMDNPGVVSWNAMIAGYAMHGYCKEAFELFELMKHTGTIPDQVSFLCILFACSHTGLVDVSCRYFNLMSTSYLIMPMMAHYVCMVDLLGRASYLEETFNFITKMPIRPDVVVWMSLLGTCRSHKNIWLGEFVSTLLFELAPKHDAPYVLLSNIYAEEGKWGDVQKLRKLMKDRGLKKFPGCSWIEVRKIIHIFCVGDKSHPQTQEIYAMLEKLSWEMKAAGYIPDTRPVLNDVEEEEKELLLCHHSEKLAIVFGLLNTTPRTTIRIVKNLRVCGDCHTATKFISKIVAREIIVRDSNRFHHFKHGQCSCGDFW